MDVVGAYVSFTEVTPGAHDGYNRWHLFDHLPEQFQLPGIAFGQRWVLLPSQRTTARVEVPLDAVHYVTLYLLTEPFEETVDAFQALGQRLYDVGRFDTNRRSPLNGPLRVADRATAPGNPLDPRGVPFAPHRSVRVVLDGDAGPLEADRDVGRWTFAGVDQLAGRRLSVTWRAAAPDNGADADVDAGAAFDATLATIDPFAPFTWFDEG